MRRYRYRTSALVGPWRETRAQAVQDAIRSNQAVSGDGEGDLIWRVPGLIDETSDGNGRGSAASD